MELSLKEITGILDVLKTIDWYSITLWLSIAVPFYYVAFKKLIPEHNPQEVQTRTQRLAKLFSIPKVESYVVFISVGLFIAGSILAVLGQNHKEKIRNQGWAIKNHMINTGFYAMSLQDIMNASGFKKTDIEELAESFPREFSLVYSKSGKAKSKKDDNPTLILSDSTAKNNLMCLSEKLLDAYLSNKYVLAEDSIKSFDTLFQQNNLFTYAVVYKLIADSSQKYTFNLVEANRPEMGFGIVRKKQSK